LYFFEIKNNEGTNHLTIKLQPCANGGNPEQAEITFSQLVEQTFKRFFQSYALAFNKQHNRKGNLFYKPFKRIKIEKDTQFTMALIYIDKSEHSSCELQSLTDNFP
jgi:hypothetical protein